jgi:hypothetical protein
MKLGFLILILAPFFSLKAQDFSWDCSLKIQDKEIHFQLRGPKDKSPITLINGKEEIRLDQSKVENDSASFPISVFDAVLKVPFPLPDRFAGYYQKFDSKVKGYQLMFQAIPSVGSQVKITSQPVPKREGKWRINFLENGLVEDSGLLVLNQSDRFLSATILTKTGDYRFLNGEISGEKAFLQTFDGSHTYYFDLVFNPENGGFEGDFFYSATGKQKIQGFRTEGNFLKDGFSDLGTVRKEFHFQARDESNRLVTEKDPAFRNKALVVQVMGTWCPNCMDESRFLTSVFPQKPSNVLFLGLAFERKNDLGYAFYRIGVVRKKLGVPYPVFWAGISNKDSASASFSNNPKIEAFPTTIFVRKDGTILKVYSGFTGPATGPFYESWKKEFNSLLAELEKS